MFRITLWFRRCVFYFILDSGHLVISCKAHCFAGTVFIAQHHSSSSTHSYHITSEAHGFISNAAINYNKFCINIYTWKKYFVCKSSSLFLCELHYPYSRLYRKKNQFIFRNYQNLYVRIIIPCVAKPCPVLAFTLLMRQKLMDGIILNCKRGLVCIAL